MPKVSVLLAVRNGGMWLPNALDSILRQSLRDFEFLVIDDGSSDGSAECVSGYCQRDSRVRLIRQEKTIGLSAALNLGLSQVTGEIVARMDADDEALPDRLAAQLAYLDAHPHVALVGSYVCQMGRRRELDHPVFLPAHPEDVARVLPKRNCFYHSAVTFRRSAVLEIGGYRTEYSSAQDYDLWLRLATRHRLANIPRPLLRYRTNVTGVSFGRRWEQARFARLAQRAAASPELALAALETEVDEELASLDRTGFLSGVCLASMHDLWRGRLRKDALKLLLSFSSELGPARSAWLLRRLMLDRALCTWRSDDEWFGAIAAQLLRQTIDRPQPALFIEDGRPWCDARLHLALHRYRLHDLLQPIADPASHRPAFIFERASNNVMDPLIREGLGLAVEISLPRGSRGFVWSTSSLARAR